MARPRSSGAASDRRHASSSSSNSTTCSLTADPGRCHQVDVSAAQATHPGPQLTVWEALDLAGYSCTPSRPARASASPRCAVPDTMCKAIAVSSILPRAWSSRSMTAIKVIHSYRYVELFRTLFLLR